jgi:hypothetical protein
MGLETPVTMAQQWNGHRWHLQRTANSGRALGAGLYSVSCTSPVSCQGVGQTTAGPVAEGWNGTRWAIEPTPHKPGAAVSGFNGVSCISASACTAVGGAHTTLDNGNPEGTLAERWNGHRWRIQPTPSSNSRSDLNAVSCTSASACTAVGGELGGTGPKPLAERWNGTSWKIQHVPVPAGWPGGYLTGVSCTSASSCTAVGVAASGPNSGPTGTIAERWNGRTWRIQPTPTANSTGDALNTISCTSASACTAVGGTASKLLAERWDGTSWTVQATPTPPNTQIGQGFTGVSCSSSSACTAVAGGFAPSGPFLLPERWNGGKWQIQPTPNLPNINNLGTPAISCPTSATCTAVDAYITDGVTLTLAEQWHGSGRHH